MKTAPEETYLSFATHKQRADRMSSGKFSETRNYRQYFIERWRSFLHANYRSPIHVAVAFGVHSDTAEKWWAGQNAPSGWIVGQAFADPSLRASALHHLAEAA